MTDDQPDDTLTPRQRVEKAYEHLNIASDQTWDGDAISAMADGMRNCLKAQALLADAAADGERYD